MLGISEVLVHVVLTAQVLTNNGTLGRTGLICKSFQQQLISGTQIWIHLCCERIHSLKRDKMKNKLHFENGVSPLTAKVLTVLITNKMPLCENAFSLSL